MRLFLIILFVRIVCNLLLFKRLARKKGETEKVKRIYSAKSEKGLK